VLRDCGHIRLFLLITALAGCAAEPARRAEPPAPAAREPEYAEPVPTDMPGLLHAIEADYRKGDYGRGLALVKRVLELPGTDVSTYDRLGSVYYILGRPGEALTFWSKALPLEKDPVRRQRLAQSIALARHNLGLPDETPAPPRRPAAVPAKVDLAGSARQYTEGLRFYAEGSYLQATAAFLRALELDPANEEARKALERLRLQNGGPSRP
jgi:tetratricopeptide (TPR) repeat protein